VNEFTVVNNRMMMIRVDDHLSRFVLLVFKRQNSWATNQALNYGSKHLGVDFAERCSQGELLVAFD
jgi:hypothetical protein